MPEAPALHSRRSLDLRFDIPISKTLPFWDSLKEGRFVTTRCVKCGKITFPPQADCPRCLSGDSSWVDLGRSATLLTFTRVQVKPASFAKEGPYTVAIGEMSEGVKVLAWLEGEGGVKAKPGLKMRIEARESQDGNPYYVFVAD